VANHTRNKKYLMAFGRHLRTLREKEDLSQIALALKCNIDKNQIGNLERGEKNPTITTLYAISKVLKISPKDLLDFEI